MPRRNPELNKIGRSENRTQKLLSVLEKRQPTLTVVAENIIDPHNLSALLRSCEAVGVWEICLVYDGSQPFPNLEKSSSASAYKWVNTKKFTSIQECYKYLREQGKKIYTTHMSRDAKSLYNLNLTEPVALVFGNEHNGISDTAVELADANFLIPQVGMIQSLNISVACAVSLYEAFRQRLKKGMYETSQLDENQLKMNLDEWCKK
jgi:tRNA (guanosine-2'-O-)-methyltransferase